MFNRLQSTPTVRVGSVMAMILQAESPGNGFGIPRETKKEKNGAIGRMAFDELEERQ